MERQEIKVRLGKKEKEVLLFLDEEGGVFVTTLFDHFCSSNACRRYLNQVVKRLLAKGLITYEWVLSLDIHHNKKYYYLTSLGEIVVSGLKQ